MRVRIDACSKRLAHAQRAQSDPGDTIDTRGWTSTSGYWLCPAVPFERLQDQLT